jgi:hypothetical protein
VYTRHGAVDLYAAVVGYAAATGASRPAGSGGVDAAGSEKAPDAVEQRIRREANAAAAAAADARSRLDARPRDIRTRSARVRTARALEWRRLATDHRERRGRVPSFALTSTARRSTITTIVVFAKK